MASLDHIKQYISAFAHGSMLIVMDDENRENEGDLIFAAEHSTPEKITFLLQHTTGIICTPLTSARAQKLGLHLMTIHNTDHHGTKFTVSCDHITTTTGVSALDRHNTIQALADSSVDATSFRKPGHVFPLIAHHGGLQARQGHTEAAVTLCALSGLNTVGVIAELMNPDGTMMRYPQCQIFSQQHNIPIITIKNLLAYMNLDIAKPQNNAPDQYVQLASSAQLTVHNGKQPMQCECRIFVDQFGNEHPVLLYGNWQEHTIVPVRIHSACFTGNTLHSMHCDCEQQYLNALQKIKEIGYGVLIYMSDHEGRGIGLTNKIKAYDLMQQGHDTIEAHVQLNLPIDMRDYTVARAIVDYLALEHIDLITNNPDKIDFFKDKVHSIIQIASSATHFNGAYLATKKLRMNHRLIITPEEGTYVQKTKYPRKQTS
ncbi:MAG: 3,4-dihydroxy-2-butanone-4-phosphate synthase [Candidatus Babeliales bacterium]